MDKATLRRRIKLAMARQNLIAYTRLTYPRYQPWLHHVLLATALQAVSDGIIKRLIVEMPPRHGKSELVSVRFPAWHLGRHPDQRIISASYTIDLAGPFSAKVRDQFNHPDWPFRARLQPGMQSREMWDIYNNYGGLIAAGVRGGITGKGGHILSIDDPLKDAEQARSKTIKDAIWDWYQGTAYPRLEDDGAIILTATRWAEDDLIGRVLQEQEDGGDEWVRLRMPAIAECNDLLGRAIGEPLWPARYSLERYAKIKRAIGSYWFNALFQQSPAAEEGNIIHPDWFHFYDRFPREVDEVVQSWDMAFKDKDDSDYVVGQVWARLQSTFYLLHQWRERADFVATLGAVRYVSDLFPQAIAKLIEDKANGPAVISALHSELFGIIPVEPRGSKEARARAITPLLEAGNVWLPNTTIAPWVLDFLEECRVFPNGANDDQVDAMTMALDYLALRDAEALAEDETAVRISRY